MTPFFPPFILANKTVQDHLLEVEESKDQMEKEMLEKIGKLEKELENANDLLSATKRKGRGDWLLLNVCHVAQCFLAPMVVG